MLCYALSCTSYSSLPFLSHAHTRSHLTTPPSYLSTLSSFCHSLSSLLFSLPYLHSHTSSLLFSLASQLPSLPPGTSPVHRDSTVHDLRHYTHGIQGTARRRALTTNGIVSSNRESVNLSSSARSKHRLNSIIMFYLLPSYVLCIIFDNIPMFIDDCYVSWPKYLLILVCKHWGYVMIVTIATHSFISFFHAPLLTLFFHPIPFHSFPSFLSFFLPLFLLFTISYSLFPHSLLFTSFSPLTHSQGAESNQASVNMRNQANRNQHANADLGSDLPVTYQLDSLQDWSVCKPGHRQVIKVKIIGQYSIEWLISRCVTYRI